MTLRQFLAVLWRRRLTIVVCIVVAVVAALAYSKLQTPRYQSTAVIQQNGVPATGSGSQSSPVTLPDPVQELGSTDVQVRAAKILGDAGTGGVAAAVTGTVDPTTGQLIVTATAATPARAHALAKAYSQAYVDQIQALVQTQVDKLSSELNTIQQQIAGLQGRDPSGTDAVNNARITGLTTTLSALQSQLTSIQIGMPYASIQVTAGVPSAPAGMGRSKLLAIGVVAGLLAGCGIALAREQLDTRLRTRPDLADITDAPVLAELPQDAEVASEAVTIAMVQAPQSQMAEAVRELRTSLRVILDDAPCPLITVTSPQPGDGKTFVAANLAAAWAMSGSKVVVVSADFRRPRIEEIFGLPLGGHSGLADLIRSNWRTPDPGRRPADLRASAGSSLRGFEGFDPRTQAVRGTATESPGSAPASVESHLVDSGIWGLQILPAGIQLDNPSELFGSPGMQPVIDQLRLLADVVLVDTPPVLVVPDTAVIGSFTQGAVVVAAEGKTDRGDLERTVHRLESTNCRVLGVALNRVRKTAASSYQSYNYRQ